MAYLSYCRRFQVTPEDLPRIEDALFFDGPHRQRSLERFTVLMFFATLIARLRNHCRSDRNCHRCHAGRRS